MPGDRSRFRIGLQSQQMLYASIAKELSAWSDENKKNYMKDCVLKAKACRLRGEERGEIAYYLTTISLQSLLSLKSISDFRSMIRLFTKYAEIVDKRLALSGSLVFTVSSNLHCLLMQSELQPAFLTELTSEVNALSSLLQQHDKARYVPSSMTK